MGDRGPDSVSADGGPRWPQSLPPSLPNSSNASPASQEMRPPAIALRRRSTTAFTSRPPPVTMDDVDPCCAPAVTSPSTPSVPDGSFHGAESQRSSGVRESFVQHGPIFGDASSSAQTLPHFSLDAAVVETIHTYFAEMDDGSGRLDRQQAEELLLRVYHQYNPARVRELTERIFAEADPAGGGKILIEEVLFCIDPNYHLENLDEDELEMLQLFCEHIAIGPPDGWRQWLWAAMNVDQASHYLTKGDWLRKLALVVQTVSQLAILTSIVNIMVESEPEIQLEADEQGRDAATWQVEAVTIAFFTVELLLRILSTPSQPEFWSNGYTWVDLLAILPFYLTELGILSNRAKGLAVLRIVRLSRLLRILKVGRHSVGIHLMVLSVRRALLPLLWLWFVLVLAMVLFSALIYQAETMQADLNNVTEKWIRPADSPFNDAGLAIDIQSIHGAMWWAVVTLSTTGYGDAVPRTPLGKVVGALTMMCGVILLAFPTTILTQQFTRVFEEYECRRVQQERKAKVRQRLLAEHFGKLDSPPMSPGTPKGDSPPPCTGLDRMSSKDKVAESSPADAPPRPPDELGLQSSSMSYDGLAPLFISDVGRPAEQIRMSSCGASASAGSKPEADRSGALTRSLGPRVRSATLGTRRVGAGGKDKDLPTSESPRLPASGGRLGSVSSLASLMRLRGEGSNVLLSPSAQQGRESLSSTSGRLDVSGMADIPVTSSLSSIRPPAAGRPPRNPLLAQNRAAPGRSSVGSTTSSLALATPARAVALASPADSPREASRGEDLSQVRDALKDVRALQRDMQLDQQRELKEIQACVAQAAAALARVSAALQHRQQLQRGAPPGCGVGSGAPSPEADAAVDVAEIEQIRGSVNGPASPPPQDPDN
eukprot:TRINITY_DN11820_c0_g1_i1.p1 TRINITY_DN11820_c0_g1~~TRINITY_DN11820_c0_g1_i1.p1  ORF type:complete len:955 (+),score=176.81 TRINITY_DN11820_c0_g1_i1:218-2866(+)